MRIEIKKKGKLSWWWFIIVPLLLLAMLFIQAFGPSPKIELGKETTVISEPLLDNGLPNYPGYILSKSKEGVTPDNNAAVLLFRALWPGELSKEQEPKLLEALSMSPPDPKQTLISAYDTGTSIKQWILNTVPDADETSLDDEFTSQIIEAAQSSTWQPGQLPTIDTWAKQNEQPLDWIREGAVRPKYYFPPPNYDSIGQESLILWLLPDVQAMRGAARALCLHSMWNLSHDRHEECLQDLLACYRIARHTNQGFTLVHNLVAIAIESMANECVHQLLHDEDTPQELLRQIKSDLDSLPPRKMMHQFFVEGERFASLDLATRLAGGKLSADELAVTQMPGFEFASSVRIDWNIVLKELNLWFDRYVEVYKLPYLERQDELENLATDLEQLGSELKTSGRLLQSIISMNARSEWIGKAMLMSLMPATEAAMRAEDRALAYEDLVHSSLALALYRAQHGEYPDTLAKLVPECASTIPLDYYTGTPLIYQTKIDEFLLYSLFEDKSDNGGTDLGGQIVEGEYQRKETNVDYEMCDLVVRMPKPPFKMPRIVLMQEAKEADNDAFADLIGPSEEEKEKEAIVKEDL